MRQRARPGGGPPAGRGGWPAAARSLLRALGRHPGLLGPGAAQVLRLARRGWWRRWPPLPLPSAELWRFRMETAYGGSGDASPGEDDVVSFLRWSRDMRRWRRR